MRESRFEDIMFDLRQLSKCVLKYCDYLENKNREISENHKSTVPIRTLQSKAGFQLKRLKKYNKRIEDGQNNTQHPWSNMYSKLEEMMDKKKLYEPINLREFSPEEKKQDISMIKS